MTVRDAKRLDNDAPGKTGAGYSQAPGDGRSDRGNVHRRRRGDARFAGLAGNVDLQAEPVAQPACFEQGAQAAELDCLQAGATSGLPLVMAFDVVARMDALIGA